MHVRFFLKNNSTKPVQDLMLPDSGGDDDGVAYFVVGTDGAYPSFPALTMVRVFSGWRLVLGTRTQVTGSDPALLGTYVGSPTNSARSHLGPAAVCGRSSGQSPRGPEPVAVLTLGDSTGDDVTEWVYLLGQALASSATRKVDSTCGPTPARHTRGSDPVGRADERPRITSGSASSYLKTPDAATNSQTGDMEVRPGSPLPTGRRRVHRPVRQEHGHRQPALMVRRPE